MDERTKRAIQERAATGKAMSEMTFRRKDGTTFEAEVSSSVFLDSDGQKITSMIIRDVTERKRAWEGQRTSEEKFIKVFHGSAAPMVITRFNDGLMLEVNDAALALFGNHRDTAVGLTTFELNAWYDLEDRKKVLQEINDKGSVSNLEVRFRKKDGQIISTLYCADIIFINGEKAVLSTMMDITERKKAEEAQRTSEQRYRQIVESAGEMIFIMQDGVFKMANPKLVEVIGAEDGDRAPL